MGYKIAQAVVDEIDAFNTGLGISYNSDGSIFQSLYITNDQALENLKTLLLTRIGERYLNPKFGTQLLNILFEPNVSDLKAEISDIITEPVGYWLPYIDIENIDITTYEDDPSLQYHIKISIRFSVSSYDVVTIIISANENGSIQIGNDK
tara:strand:+ start:385 stop:834 length:450 start_codon:yes stop_codon:yes gene_type:complete